MKKTIILIGGGGHCKSCIDVIEKEGRFDIAGIVDKLGAKVVEHVLGYPVIGKDDDLRCLFKKCSHALVTVGQIKSPNIRMRIYSDLVKIGFKLPVIVSPLAYISPHAKIKHGTIIMHNALVNAGVSIGANCIVNTKALVEHDAIIENNCHIATGAIVNGNVIVKEGTFLGSNSMIAENITIGKECVVGGGARVLRNLKDNTRHAQ